MTVVAVHQRREQTGIHRLRVSEYLVLAEQPDWPRTELLDGVIYDMPSESRLHADGVMATYKKLDAAYPEDRVCCAGSVQAGEHSMPEPDVYVERADADKRKYTDAVGLLLVVEVSVTTLKHDRGPKLRAYAAEGVPEYWIVVPAGSTSYLLRHTDPVGTAYRRVVEIALPDGVDELDVAAIQAS